MNRELTSGVEKRVILIVIAALTLAMGILVAQRMGQVSTAINPEMQPARANVANTGVTPGESAPAARTPHDLLERELKAGWHAQVWGQQVIDAAGAPGQDGLERELKEVWRANMAAQSAAGPDLLERELKQTWHAILATLETGSAVSTAQDQSGLERELKETVRANGAVGTGETPSTAGE